MSTVSVSSEREDILNRSAASVLVMYAVTACNELAMSGIKGIFALYSESTYNVSTAVIGGILFGAQFASAIGTYSYCHLGKKFGFGKIVTCTFIPSVFAGALMGFAPDLAVFIVCYILLASCSTLDEIAISYTSIIVPRDWAQYYSPIDISLVQICAFTGILSFAILYEYVHPRAPFVAVSVICFICLVVSWDTLFGVQHVLREEQMELEESRFAEIHTLSLSVDQTFGFGGESSESDDDSAGYGGRNGDSDEERSSFPVFLTKRGLSEETFIFWELSGFQKSVFVLETILYSCFHSSVMIFAPWWPLFALTQYGIGPSIANAQIVLTGVVAAIPSLWTAKLLTAFAKWLYGTTPVRATSTSADFLRVPDSGDMSVPPAPALYEGGITQNNRDRATLIVCCFTTMFLICCQVSAIVFFYRTFAMSWVAFIFFGLGIGFGFELLPILMMRFQRRGTTEKVFAIQGFCWQTTLALSYALVGLLWVRLGPTALPVAVLVLQSICLCCFMTLFGVLSNIT